MSGTPMRYPVSSFTSNFFGIGVTCNDHIAPIAVFKWLEFYRFLNIRKSLFFSFLFTGKTVRIEPATSLFIISHPVCDAIVSK